MSYGTLGGGGDRSPYESGSCELVLLCLDGFKFDYMPPSIQTA